MKDKIEKKVSGDPNTIIVNFNVLRGLLVSIMSYEAMAKVLETSVEELEKYKDAKDEEISYDLLFRFYFLAQMTIDNPCREDFTHQMAEKLKETCAAEYIRRKES